MNNIIDKRQKVTDDLNNEKATLETERNSLKQKEENLRVQSVLKAQRLHKNIDLEFSENLKLAMENIRKIGNDERVKLTNGYINYINDSARWGKEAESLTLHAMDKLKHMESL